MRAKVLLIAALALSGCASDPRKVMTFVPADCTVVTADYRSLAMHGMSPEERTADPALSERQNEAVRTVAACDHIWIETHHSAPK